MSCSMVGCSGDFLGQDWHNFGPRLDAHAKSTELKVVRHVSSEGSILRRVGFLIQRQWVPTEPRRHGMFLLRRLLSSLAPMSIYLQIPCFGVRDGQAPWIYHLCRSRIVNFLWSSCTLLHRPHIFPVQLSSDTSSSLQLLLASFL